MGLVIRLIISAVLIVAGFLLYKAAKHTFLAFENDGSKEATKRYKRLKRRKNIPFFIMILGAWYFLGTLLSYISGKKSGGISITFEMFSERINLFGISVAKTTVLTWVIIAVILLFALIFRFFLFPKFREIPKGIQNAMEAGVEAMDNFTAGVVGKKFGKSLSPYMFSIAFLMVGSAASELFGQRAPTSDLVMTGTMGVLTLILINIYGLRAKGFSGRIKSMGGPMKPMAPLMFVLKVISDVSIPVSLACRLFGNMLGGMIVMDLLKSSLGGYGLGITSVAGIYFNLFHPLIQTYIFIVLSLTFINEAAE